MVKFKRSYVAPYRNLPKDVKNQVDQINKLRNYRAGGAALLAAGLAGLAASYEGITKIGPGLGAPRSFRASISIPNVSIAANLAGATLTHLAEKAVIHETRKLGKLVGKRAAYELIPLIELPPAKTAHHEEVTTAGLASMLTHAHVDRKGNIVFTRESKYAGREIIPKALKPTTWRWRMKVPLRVKP